MIDLTVSTEKPTSLAEVLAVFRRAAKGELVGVLAVSEEELVSSDYLGNPHSAIIDAPACLELNPQVSDLSAISSHVAMLSFVQFFKIMAWYDNEWGYSNRLLDLARHVASQELGA